MMTIEEKLRKIMKATGWKQAQLAERLSTTQATVSRWFSGSEPEGPRRDAINQLYDQFVDEAPPEDDGAAVPIMGFIGAGAEILPEFEQVPPEGLDQVHVPFPLPEDMIALQVRGDSMLPVYKDGHIVIVYRDQKRPVTSFYGEDAAVRTSDGRRFLKTIIKSTSGVTLMSFNAAPIENVQLAWIGEIFAVLPRSAVNKITKKGGIQGRLSLT